MRSLLDVNVLIALFDVDHSLHRAALHWFTANAAAGWSSCPITQNGCVRVMSHSAYPNRFPVDAVVQRLRDATREPPHQFWPDEISLLDQSKVDSSRIHGSRQITDVYLLMLAAHHGGRLVTFDRAISTDAVVGVSTSHLLKL
jgi:uncharacterized protein